jgi:hypothetical protein
MAIVLNEKHFYSQSSADLYKIYITEGWIYQRYQDISARNVNVISCEEIAGVHTVHSKREVEADIPKALAKLAGQWNSVEHKETWTAKGEGVYDCQFSSVIIGLPIKIEGNMFVQPHGDGSVNIIQLKVSCALPFIGKIAEKFVAGDSGKSMQAEHGWIKDFLNNQT